MSLSVMDVAMKYEAPMKMTAWSEGRRGKSFWVKQRILLVIKEACDVREQHDMMLRCIIRKINSFQALLVMGMMSVAKNKDFFNCN
jgi:hypothetical protein